RGVQPDGGGTAGGAGTRGPLHPSPRGDGRGLVDHGGGALGRHEAGGWRTVAAGAGTRAFVLDEQRLVVRGEDGWDAVGATPDRLDELEGLGVGTASDPVNTFAAKLNSALWTARAEDEGGTGDLRYV